MTTGRAGSSLKSDGPSLSVCRALVRLARAGLIRGPPVARLCFWRALFSTRLSSSPCRGVAFRRGEPPVNDTQKSAPAPPSQRPPCLPLPLQTFRPPSAPPIEVRSFVMTCRIEGFSCSLSQPLRVACRIERRRPVVEVTSSCRRSYTTDLLSRPPRVACRLARRRPVGRAVVHRDARRRRRPRAPPLVRDARARAPAPARVHVVRATLEALGEVGGGEIERSNERR